VKAESHAVDEPATAMAASTPESTVEDILATLAAEAAEEHDDEA
jgi:hypothetical protein